MNTNGNLDTRRIHRAAVTTLGLVVFFAILDGCGGSDDTPGGDAQAGNAMTSAGTMTSGGSSSAGGTAQAGQTTAGQASNGGQAAAGGQNSTAGQTSTGGQNATGGQSTTGGQHATGGQNANGGSGGNGSCQHAQLKGSDVCTIGDSWIQLQGNQVTTLENHMIAANVLPQGDHFDRREVSGSTLSAIIKTYSDKPSNCKILVMDGGGIDLFTTALGDQPAIDKVVQAFTAFLTKVKADGYVQHIIYSLYPVIPTTKNLNANMKPGFSAACAASGVDCHLVDLEPLFQGQHFASDNTHPDNAGGVIIGDAWWKAMKENCVAQ